MKTDKTDVLIIAGCPVFSGFAYLAMHAAERGLQRGLANLSSLINWRQALTFRKMRLARIQSEQGL